MIRRDYKTAGGEPAWLLISQVDHARLARDLAAAWRKPLLSLPGADDGELLAAIEHHDDGWARWETNPGVDPSTGRPRSFMEMAVAEWVNIWSHSIEEARKAGPLAGATVAGHFLALLERFDSWRAGSEVDKARVKAFCDYFQSRRLVWASVYPLVEADQRQAIADEATKYLQAFDLLSLWLCCNQAPEPTKIAFPGGTDIEFRALRDNRITADPWLLESDMQRFEVAGDVLPRGRYTSGEEVRLAQTGRMVISWTFYRDG